MDSSKLILAAISALSLASPLASGAPQSTPDLPDGVSADDWAQVRSAITAQRHQIQSTGSGYEAANPGLGMTARFDGDSTRIEPRDGDWLFGLALRSYGFEGQTTDVDAPAFGACAAGQELTYEWTEGLSEWWVNDSRGFEHGFNIWERPACTKAAGSRGPLTFSLDVLGHLTPELNEQRTGLVLRGEDGEVALRYEGLFAVDANGVMLNAWLGVNSQTLTISVDESNAQYPIVVDPIVQQAYLKASNTECLDSFGASIAVSGDTLVVGAPFEDSNATGVDGDQANNSGFVSGAVYVFVRSGDTWAQKAYLKASNTGIGDGFGASVAMSGDTVVVGASFEDSAATGVNGNEADNSAPNSGAAYVFVRSGGIWIQEAYLKASNTGSSDSFGISVSASGDTVVVGATSEDSGASGVDGNGADNSASDSGAAYVFVRSGTTWSQQAYLKASNTDADDRFGFSVGVSGDSVAVGAFFEDSGATGVNGNEADGSASNSGAAYVFGRSGGAWSQEAYLKASNTDPADRFGFSVAASGDTVMVGAPLEASDATGVNGDEADNSSNNSGAGYVFVRSGGTWSQQAYLKASNTDGGDEFGAAVSASGGTVVVSAPLEQSAATGVNGNEADNLVDEAGAAYVFVRSGNTWSQTAYLKASNTGNNPAFAIGDRFGNAIAVSGATVVVGAPGEDSNATGVNGDEADNSQSRSGAAYAFGGLVGPGMGDLVCVGTPNSTSFGGTLTALGSLVVSDNSLALEIACCPPSSFGLVVASSSNGGPIQNVNVGEGVLCIANLQIGRFSPIVTTATGTALQAVDLTAIPTSVGPATALPGDTYYFQFWHRDSLGGAPTSNLTSAISILFE